jgi:hypothetical protein
MVSYWDGKLIVDGSRVSLSAFMSAYDNMVDFNNKIIKQFSQQVLDGKHDTLTLYSTMWPLAIGKEEASLFTDIASVEWATESINELARLGVVNGKAEGIFAPDDTVTREEFVIILYRFADQVMGEDVQYGRAAITGFADRTTISSWAHNAVKWAYATKDDLQPTIPGIIQYEKTQYITGKGTKNGKPLFAPKANATRGEVATMLYRYMTAERIAKA